MTYETTIFGEDWSFSKAKSTLLQSAAEVMCEQGPRAATLKNIAGNAGVTEPAIFRHFDGVDGVFQSLFTVYELYFNLFQTYFKTAEYTGIDRLESALLQRLQAMRADKKFAYLLAQPDAIFRQYPKLKKRMQEMRAKDRAAILDCLKEAKTKGQLLATVDIEGMAGMVNGTLNLLLVGWNDSLDAVDILKDGKKILTQIRSMIAKAGNPSKVSLKPLPVISSPQEAPVATKKAKTQKPAADKTIVAPKAAEKAASKASKTKPKAKAGTKPAAKQESIATTKKTGQRTATKTAKADSKPANGKGGKTAARSSKKS